MCPAQRRSWPKNGGPIALCGGLEALLAVVDASSTLLVTGTGDVIQPTDIVLGIGSGGNYAVAAAKALIAAFLAIAADIVRKSLEIAAEIDIYTNTNIVVEELPSTNRDGPDFLLCKN